MRDNLIVKSMISDRHRSVSEVVDCKERSTLAAAWFFLQSIAWESIFCAAVSAPDNDVFLIHELTIGGFNCVYRLLLSLRNYAVPGDMDVFF